MRTDSDMLREVVKRGIKGGWENTKVFDINDISDETKDNIESKHSYDDMARIAVAVLIADHEFMKAVYGEEVHCDKCGEVIGEYFKKNGTELIHTCDKECYVDEWIPSPLYHALEALKLLHDPEGNAIKYLYDTLPENV